MWHSKIIRSDLSVQWQPCGQSLSRFSTPPWLTKNHICSNGIRLSSRKKINRSIELHAGQSMKLQPVRAKYIISLSALFSIRYLYSRTRKDVIISTSITSHPGFSIRPIVGGWSMIFEWAIGTSSWPSTYNLEGASRQTNKYKIKLNKKLTEKRRVPSVSNFQIKVPAWVWSLSMWRLQH